MSPPPPWRRVFDKVERTVGKPLEDAVGSRRYMNVAVLGRRVRGAVSGALDRPTSAVLHLVNIPAREDVRRLSRQIATLTNEVRELTAGVEELREPAPPSEPPPPSEPTASVSQIRQPKASDSAQRRKPSGSRQQSKSSNGKAKPPASKAQQKPRQSGGQQDATPTAKNDA